MKSTDEIKRLAKKIRIKTSTVTRERILSDAEAALMSSMEKGREVLEPGLSIWRTIMKSRITKIAACVAIIMSILAGANHLGLQVRATAPVFADMIEQISKAHCVTCKITTYTEHAELSTSELIVNESGVTRYVGSRGGVSVYDRRSGKELRLDQKAKKALLIYKVGRDKGNGLINYLDWLSNLHEQSGQFKGQEEIDGRIVNVFVVEQDWRATIRTNTIWVDPETDLPVRVQQVDMPDPNEGIMVPEMSLHEGDFGGEGDACWGISIGGEGVQRRRTTVWSEFVWNPDLDESLFSLEPPEDYFVEEVMYDVSDRGENGLIDAFIFWTEMSGGVFPSEIDDLGDPNKVKPMLVEKFDRDGDPKEELDRAMQQMNLVLKGLWFTQKYKVQGNWHYCGHGVRLGDTERPVCWWKPQDSPDYRVVYGDLSLRDMPAVPEPREQE
ncbi:MAG: hypothetical protein ACYSTZ_00700 [Planctomycetota bacterium]|jgi:hypothetical protein